MRRILPDSASSLFLTVILLSASAPLLTAQSAMFDVTPANAPPPETHTAKPAQSPLSGNFVVKTTVHRVVLDIVVTDPHGLAVPALTRKDFTVAESGKSQRVLSFEDHQFPAQSAALPTLPAMPVNTFVNVPKEAERGPLYVIVYDAVDSSWEDQARARRQLMEFLATKPAGTRFAMFIVSDGVHLAQGFTTDPKELLTVFDVHRQGAAHIPWIFLYGENYFGGVQQPLQILTNIARYLEGLPGRKNLIWMSSAMPVAFPGGGYQGAAPVTGPSTSSIDVEDEIRAAVNALTAAQVSVYPIDTAGLRVDTNGIDTTADEIANDTGGHAYYNGNDLKLALTRATENGSNYYEVSYSPSNQKYDGKIRRIDVKLEGALAKKGYHLAYRRFYYGDDLDSSAWGRKPTPDYPEHPVATKLNDALVAHLEHGAPVDHDLLFRAHVRAAGVPTMGTPEQMASLVSDDAYLRARSKNKAVKLPKAISLQTYAIDYTVLDASLRQPAKTPTETGPGQPNPARPVFEFGVAAYDAEGQLMNGSVQNATRVAQEGAGSNALFRVQQTLDVPTQAAWLRVAVRDLSNQRIGTLEISLPLAPESASAAIK